MAIGTSSKLSSSMTTTRWSFVALGLVLLQLSLASAFQSPSPHREESTASSKRRDAILPHGSTSHAKYVAARPTTTLQSALAAASKQGSEAAKSSSAASALDVVLFGVGDLRVDDHVGLSRALAAAASKDDTVPRSTVLPLVVLTDATLTSLPGAVAHTVDTAHLLHHALSDLDTSLQRLDPELRLHVVTQSSGGTATDLVSALENLDSGNILSSHEKIRIHVCDLGDADNAMGYGALGGLVQSFVSLDQWSSAIEIVRWSASLRDDPWNDVESLPELYTDYERKYVSTSIPTKPVDVAVPADSSFQAMTVAALQTIPTVADVLDWYAHLLELPSTSLDVAAPRVGLYGTHWGGLSTESIGSQVALSTLEAFQRCDENDVTFAQDAAYPECQRNPLSLEHSSMVWQLHGADKKTQHWLPGETLTRFLAAPLLFGTVSPRRVWHSGRDDMFLSTSPLRRLVEGQEWHRLFAARNMHVDSFYQGQGETVYKYWRYHGFLCRYAQTDMRDGADTDNKEGILLVHGFGASGSQWNKAMTELRKLSSDTNVCQGLAPDLIGFGHSEKPGISYSGYMWDAQMMEFVKEICISQQKWKRYVTGGNSIGGFTSMSLAACDSATAGQISSSGATGTGLCSGLVLMNSAGPVKTREDIQELELTSKGIPINSVAQRTSLDALPVCKPPPRLVGLGIGTALLGYLRPRIQSICVNLYPTNPAAVDSILCDSIRRDSLDPGAINVMMAGAKLPAPRTANELLAADFGAAGVGNDDSLLLGESSFSGPVLIAQGILDPLNDAKDRLERYVALRQGIDETAIQAGHCPHDELPEQVAMGIAKWLPTRPIRSQQLSMKN